MPGRRLDPEEQALWRRVTENVRPLSPPRMRRAAAAPAATLPDLPAPVPVPAKRAAPVPPRLTARPAVPGDTLDGGWDRRLSKGLIAPERTIDLHGHTLASAHAALDHALERAIADGARLVLLITGRPPRPDHAGQGAPRRGAIRAAIGDWIGGSRHAARIAAVRNAHPRHGGGGALYVVLRRNRTG
ncbi:MAG: Smr protein/MutS2 [Sphingomonas bacterium]|nr:Smr protein/MutS2 [Sphingomonas bacterium]